LRIFSFLFCAAETLSLASTTVDSYPIWEMTLQAANADRVLDAVV